MLIADTPAQVRVNFCHVTKHNGSQWALGSGYHRILFPLRFPSLPSLALLPLSSSFLSFLPRDALVHSAVMRLLSSVCPSVCL